MCYNRIMPLYLTPEEEDTLASVNKNSATFNNVLVSDTDYLTVQARSK